MRNCDSTVANSRVTIVAVFMFILSLNLFAQYSNPDGIETNILSTGSNSTIVEYLFTDYDEEFLFIDGIKHVFYKIPGSIWFMEKGMPQLPTDRRSIIIPDLAAKNY